VGPMEHPYFWWGGMWLFPILFLAVVVWLTYLVVRQRNVGQPRESPRAGGVEPRESDPQEALCARRAQQGRILGNEERSRRLSGVHGRARSVSLERRVVPSYSNDMAGFASKMAGTSLMLVLALSPLAGLVCADGPDEKQAMECCRGDAHHCNMPEKTEDCCKPDRSSQNPASVETSSRASVDLESASDTTLVTPVVTLPDAGYRAIPFSASRGSPYLLANRPLDVPLLN